MMHAIVFSLIDFFTIVAGVLWIAVSEQETPERSEER
jgi:hypothetical protein